MSYIYKWMQKHTVEYLRVVVVPIVTLVVTGLLSICVIGPIGYNLGVYRSGHLHGLCAVF